MRAHIHKLPVGAEHTKGHTEMFHKSSKVKSKRNSSFERENENEEIK